MDMTTISRTIKGRFEQNKIPIKDYLVTYPCTLKVKTF